MSGSGLDETVITLPPPILHRSTCSIRPRSNALDIPERTRNETSMEELSSVQEDNIVKLTERYADLKNSMGGVGGVIEDLRQYLIAEYPKQAPEYHGVLLPLTWNELQQLKRQWTDGQYQEVLKLYYTNPVHNLYRYLLRPNPWMSPNAKYVIRSPNQEAYADLDQHLGLMATMWLAASDLIEAGSPQQQASMRADFVAIVSELNRSHNYDDKDDMLGDAPSCQDGVRTRLYNSLTRHSLIKIDCEAVAIEELRKFYHNMYKSVLRELSDEAFDNALEQANIGGEISAFKKMNLCAKKDEFIDELRLQLVVSIFGGAVRDDKHNLINNSSVNEICNKVEKSFNNVTENGSAFFYKNYLKYLFEGLFAAEEERRKKPEAKRQRTIGMSPG